ncbi:MAG: hypothetical protein IJW29_00175 [Clostridia bacterium]|nr:hypothetical protein [Clostridia bacterium]
MKNPIKHLKHMWKDPINTIEEADARKKEIMPWFLGSIGVAVLFCALDGILGTGILMILGLIGVFGVMAFGFMLFIIKKAKEKFAALTCDACKTMAKFENEFDYAAHVSYEVSESISSNINAPKPNNNGVITAIRAHGYGSASVKIDLTCPNCKAVKKLVYNITPFKCEVEQKNVAARDSALVQQALLSRVNAVLDIYKNPETRKALPYTIQSVHHPDYENREKPTTKTTVYQDVTIKYRREADELVDGFFLHNELNGTIKVDGKDGK